MRKVILLALSLLAVSATLAGAAGLNLRWTACAGDGGVQNRTFACDTNAGGHDIAGSFVLDSDLEQVNGNELVVDITFIGPTVPEWWKFKNAGSCRMLALSIAAQDGVSCPDQFLGQASMNIAAYQAPTFLGPDRARILCVNAVPPGYEVNLVAGQEYGIARWRITNTKTVGTGACGGCTTQATIVFGDANIWVTGSTQTVRLTAGTGPGSNCITWQWGLVPTRKSTWRAVKSLYR